MNAKELEQFYKEICHCKNPADVFTTLRAGKIKEAELQKEYRTLMMQCHPDKFASSDSLIRHMAEEIASVINEMYALAVNEIKSGCKPSAKKPEERVILFEIKTKNNLYLVHDHSVEGEYASIYTGTCGTDSVCVKIVHEKSDNKLLMNEVKVMKRLTHKSLPAFLDVFKTSDGTMGLVMREIDGYDLTQIREKYADGLSPRHVCWIFERLLSVLGFMHINKILHGNIEPSNVMVRPRDHNSFLIDFLFSLIEPMDSGETVGVYSEEYSHREIAGKYAPMPHHDLYSLAKCMIYLLGGNVENNKIPSEVNITLRRFILEFIHCKVTDAWQKHKELRDLRKKVLGHKGFVTFDM